MRRRLVRLLATLLVTGLATAYIVWKIDVARTAHILVHANVWYFLGAVAITIGSVWPMAWRWQRLLAAKAIHDRLPWLVRAYFVAYTAGQILPTAVGGDAVRIYETARRHSGRGGQIAGSVLLERPIRAAYEGIHSYREHPGLLGGVFTLTLAVQSVRVLAIWPAGKAVEV